MLLSGAWRLAQSLHESDLEGGYRRRSVCGRTVVDFARNLDSRTGKRDERAVERRKSIGLTCRFFRGVRCARAERHPHHSRRAGEDECRGAECVQFLSRDRSSTVRRGPSHAPGQRDSIRKIGWIGLGSSRCRIPRETAGTLRGQNDGRQRADDQDDDATLTGPLRHSGVLPYRGGKNTPNQRTIVVGDCCFEDESRSRLIGHEEVPWREKSRGRQAYSTKAARATRAVASLIWISSIPRSSAYPDSSIPSPAPCEWRRTAQARREGCRTRARLRFVLPAHPYDAPVRAHRAL
jgi:hypothetical protein